MPYQVDEQNFNPTGGGSFLRYHGGSILGCHYDRAEAYTEFLKKPYRAQFLAAQTEAKSAKRGIWGLSGYERPKDFKKRLKVR